MKRNPILFRIPLRTEKIWDEAKTLEENNFFLPAILRYTNYLEHFLIISILSYHERRNIMSTQTIQKNILCMKLDKKLTFSAILRQVPSDIMTDDVKQLCNEVKNIRNTIAAHNYFVIALDKTRFKKRKFNDVNIYRKFIRNLYKLIRNIEKINQVENFLSIGHPLTTYSHLEENAYEIEVILMESICIHIRKTVQNTIQKIEHELYKNDPYSNLNKFQQN